MFIKDILDYLDIPVRHGRSQEEIDNENEEITNEFINNFKIAFKNEKKQNNKNIT
jgi:hypothetical protein